MKCDTLNISKNLTVNGYVKSSNIVDIFVPFDMVFLFYSQQTVKNQLPKPLHVQVDKGVQEYSYIAREKF